MPDYKFYQSNQGDLVVRGRFPGDARIGRTSDQLWSDAEPRLRQQCSWVERLEDSGAGTSTPELQARCRPNPSAGHDRNRFLYVTRSVAELHLPEEELYQGDVARDAETLLKAVDWALTVVRALGATTFEVGRENRQFWSVSLDSPRSVRDALLHNALAAHDELDSDLDAPDGRYEQALAAAGKHKLHKILDDDVVE